MKLVIEGDEGRQSVVPVGDEMTIGRDEGNTVHLPDRNISRRHARLFQEDGKLLIEDLRSFTGIRVNGQRIGAPTPIKEGDRIEVGDYELSVEGKLERPSGSTDALPVAHPTSQPGGAAAIIRGSEVVETPKVELRDLDPAETPRLVGLSGPVRGKEFHLTRTLVKFGRASENDLAVDHQSVSRAHARFVLHDGDWKVLDNQSANGIRINGEEYVARNLKPGDTIELGHLKFRFCGPGEKFALPEGSAPEIERVAAPEMIGSEGSEAVDAPGPSGVRVAALAVVLLTALAAASWVFGRGGRNHERAPHGETAPFARAPAAAEAAPLAPQAPVEARRPAAIVANPAPAAEPAPASNPTTAAANPAPPAEPAPGSNPTTAAANGALATANPSTSKPAAREKASPATAPAPVPPETREAQATRLAAASNQKLNAHDFEGAVSDAQAALDLAPEAGDTLCTAYHSLGYGFAYLNDNRSARKYLEEFKPCCARFGEAACAQVEEFLSR